MAQPIITTNLNLQDEIKENVFGCGDDMAICCCGCWCFPCLFGANAQRIDGKNCFVMCVAYALLIECYLCWVPHFLERQKFRQKYNLKPDNCNDILLTMCCGPCAMCQETREMNRRENPANIANGGPIVVQPQAQFQPYGSYYPEEQYQQPVQYQPQDYYQSQEQYLPQEQYQPQNVFMNQEQYQQPESFVNQEQSEPEKPKKSKKPKIPFNLQFNFDPQGGSTAQVHFDSHTQNPPQQEYQSYDQYSQYPPQNPMNNMTL